VKEIESRTIFSPAFLFLPFFGVMEKLAHGEKVVSFYPSRNQQKENDHNQSEDDGEALTYNNDGPESVI
jgi:hypothetical protein